MFEKMGGILRRYEEVLRELASPEASQDPVRLSALMKEQAGLSPIAAAYEAFEKARKDAEESEELLSVEADPEMRQMLREEYSNAQVREEALKKKLRILLLPSDPDNGRNAILEIRAGTGGDEAAFFAAELYRMYSRYADRRGWRTEMISLSENGLGGFKAASRAARTACSGCPRPKATGGFTPRPSRWRCSRKPRRWTWRSIRRIVVSTFSGLPETADRASIPRTPPCG